MTVDRPGSSLYVASIKQSGARNYDESEANSALIVAACNSYQRHCPDPVSAAEGDLLGRCVEALAEVVGKLEACSRFAGNDDWVIEGMVAPYKAILSQVREVRG